MIKKKGIKDGKERERESEGRIIKRLKKEKRGRIGKESEK